MRVMFLLLTLLLAVLCAACNTPHTGLLAPESPALAGPQSAADTNLNPAAPEHLAGLAGLLPAPSELRRVSWNPLENLAYGSLYIDFWPHANVECPSPPLAEFSSEWQSQASPVFDDLAYALYAMEVAPGSSAVLATSWTTPPQAQGCYIGLANITKNAWDWYACSGEDINLPPLAPYLNEGIARLAMVVLEQGPLELEWLRIGDNLPPDARLDADAQYICAGDLVNFDLGGSIDPELDIALYEFDFDGDGSYETSSPDVPTSAYTYVLPGTYAVVGRVTDGEGLSVTDETTVYVSGFTPELIDATGFSPSLVINGAGAPEIAYSGGTDNAVLRLATVIPDGWNIDDLDTPPGDDDLQTAMMLEPGTGAEVIAYGGGELRVGRREGLSFNMVLLDDEKGSGKPAVAYDGDGFINIFYSRLEGSFPLQTAHFTRAYETGSDWGREQLSAEEPTGKYCDAVYEGYLTCAYAADQEQSNGRLMFGFYSTISGWTWITARQNMHRYNSRVSLAINPLDHMPCIAYIGDRDGTGAYYDAVYTWYAEDDWLAETLEEFAWDCDVVLDSGNHPRAVVSRRWIDPERYQFWYHWYDGAEWHREFVAESGAGAADYVELALDAGDTAHICWSFTPEGETASQLWYSTEQY